MARYIELDPLVAWAKETYLCEKAGMIRKVCFKQLQEYLNTLEVKDVQEEPVSNPTPNEKMSVERWKEACKAACCDRNYRSHCGLTETSDDYFVDGVQWADEHPKEEPVNKDLEEASKKWLGPQLDKSYAAYGEAKMMELTHFDGYAMLDAIEFGAKWKEGLYKKNLLDVCKKQTEEEAEIERDFIEGIIDEHRLPTFDDAIKYGMRLQKEQFEKEHTKNCSNVEYEQDVYPPACQPWLTPDQAKKAVEIATKKVIEETAEWLTKHAKKYYFNKERYLGTDELVEDYKLIMSMKDD